MVAAGEADIVPNIAVQDATNPATDFTYPNSETTSFMRIDTHDAADSTTGASARR